GIKNDGSLSGIQVNLRYFTIFAGSPACNQQAFTVATEDERLNPLWQALDTTSQPACLAVPEGDFVIASDRDFVAARCKSQCHHRRSSTIDGGSHRVLTGAEQIFEGNRGIGAVELRAFTDPFAKLFDLR